jgi:hypothetical protein
LPAFACCTLSGYLLCLLQKRAVGLGVSDHKMQQTLRIVAGTAAGKKLVSFRGSQTRPMMEKVRQAIFNMIQNQAGTINSLPKRARWLDLFAGEQGHYNIAGGRADVGGWEHAVALVVVHSVVLIMMLQHQC